MLRTSPSTVTSSDSSSIPASSAVIKKSVSVSSTSRAGRQVRPVATGIDVAWGTHDRKTRSISRCTFTGLRRTDRRTIIMVNSCHVTTRSSDCDRAGNVSGDYTASNGTLLYPVSTFMFACDFACRWEVSSTFDTNAKPPGY